MNGSNAKTGRIATKVPAAINAISTPRCDCSEANPTGSVLVLGPLRIRAKRNSFQLRMKASMPAAA